MLIHYLYIYGFHGSINKIGSKKIVSPEYFIAATLQTINNKKVPKYYYWKTLKKQN